MRLYELIEKLNELKDRYEFMDTNIEVVELHDRNGARIMLYPRHSPREDYDEFAYEDWDE